MNRPTPVKPDNFFLMIFRALRQRRIPLALRIASTNIFLVALALVIYALSLIHISEPTRPRFGSRMPSSA